ncbi:MAG TPA: PKD domain-containing protein, partial [Pyrinomonadaceae bacterium]|nr:PKD domain-containing protein [Pyrinomonadaceae bacterium]
MQIYVMNSDGTGQTRLTIDGSNNENPRWSPDGTKILFQSDRDNQGSGSYDIYVMNANGSGQTRLTTDANDDSAASWSPDGTKIVFQSLRNGVNYQVYTMNANGSGQTNISNNGANETQPSWSPDGVKIAFASDRDQPGCPSIYVMNSNGTNQIRLTYSGTGLRDEQPVWSPNASKIAFTSTRDSSTDTWQETDDDGNYITKSRLNINKEVYVMNADGSGQTRLTNNLSNDDAATWSADGAKIVFRSERERDTFDPTAQIWTMNPDGSNQLNLSNSGDGDYSPSWTNGAANQAPVANSGGPYNGMVSQNVPFNSNGSFDPDGTIVSYSWNFGDGGTSSGAAPTHAYSAIGNFTITLTVTDNVGAQGTASTTVNISASSSDQFVANFLQWGLGRTPTSDESSYWTDILRAAYPQGQTSMM